MVRGYLDGDMNGVEGNTTNFISPTLPILLAYSCILGENAAVSISFLKRYFIGQVTAKLLKYVLMLVKCQAILLLKGDR